MKSSSNIIRGGKTVFVPIATASFTKTNGADQYNSTDVSATTGTDTSKVWVIVASANSVAICGARPYGSAIDSKCDLNNTVTLFSSTDNAGHMDLYSNVGATIKYSFIGYLQ